MRILLGASRTFDNYDLFKEKMDRFTAKLTKAELVVPERYKKKQYVASTLLRMAQQYIDRKKCWKVVIFYPDVEQYGAEAGKVRDGEAVEFVKEDGSAAVFFWNGTEGSGTERLLLLAEEEELKIKVVDI